MTARFPAQQAANIIDISNGNTLNILQNVLKTKSKSASWVLHFHIEIQKQGSVKLSKKLLKTFPLYNWHKFSNTLTGDVSWIYSFEPL